MMSGDALLLHTPWVWLALLGAVVVAALSASWMVYRALRHERRMSALAAQQWAQERVARDADYAELQQRHQALAVEHAGLQAGLAAERDAHQAQLQT